MIKKVRSLILETGLLRHSGMIFAASFLGSLCLFISSILLARFFGPVDFANFKIATNLFIFLPSLIEFGIGVTLTKYIAEYSVHQAEKIPHLVVKLLQIRAISFSVMIAALYFLRVPIAEMFFHTPLLGPFVLAGLWISGFIYFEVFKQISLGFQEFRTFAGSQFLMLFLSGLLSLVLGYFYGVFWAIIGWGLAYVIGNLPSLWMTMQKVKSSKGIVFDTTPILLGYSLPMYSLLIPNLLGTALVPLLSLFFSKSGVGLFAFGMIFYNGAVLIPTAFTQVLLPKLSQAQAKKENTRQLLVKNLKQYSLVAIPSAILAVLLSPWIVNLVAPNYANGTAIVQGLLVACLALGYLSLIGTYFTATRQVKANWLVTLLRNGLLLATAFGLLSLNA